MMPLRVAIPNSVMKPTSEAMLTTPPPANTATTPPIRASGRFTMTSTPSRADPKAVVRERPELAGTLLELRAAELVAKEAYSDARDQARFVARVREALAAEIERGEALSAVRVRPREAQREPARPRAIERAQARVLA